MKNEYMIWSNYKRAWWGPDDKGYTINVKEAGIYSKEEALKTCALGRDGLTASDIPDDLPVSKKDWDFMAEMEAGL